ncbi:hypothetical protein EJ06DRAFT_532049 [Trichodelitschia bisporula]|uniref:Uncharacterized protein n=1 Tax=Trichodelitschia bisporula TaxID=703511 RepID=A0A6G1HQK6_9PEZI|nr:hypothetical protein EJ06DRAFT_532049 [Trichodelitschia bisporula]
MDQPNDSGGSSLDIDAILRSISQFIPQQQPQLDHAPTAQPGQQQAQPQLHHGSSFQNLEQQQVQLSTKYTDTPASTPTSATSLYGVISGQQRRQSDPDAQPPARTLSPTINPATITEWRTAVRCVTTMMQQNPQFAAHVRKMIADQDQNLKQWWKDREALIVKQKSRIQRTKELNNTLKALGAAPASDPTDEENIAELAHFDVKVYKASQRMVDVHTGELKRLGVPFFGIKPERVTKTPSNDPNDTRITEEQLLQLQRRMIEYLEDLYRD